MTENEKYIYDHFITSIKSGLQSLDDVIDETLEIVEDEGWQKEIDEEWVRNGIRNGYAKHIESSKGWQHPTDPEKLRQAFDSLCKEKIVALHNAGYTQSEALEDISDVWQDLEDAYIQPIGYCYYHGQDLDRAINDGGLMIGFYGKKEKNDKEAIIIGHKVVNALKAVGFDVKWNHAASQRIEIPDFKWENVFTSDEDVDSEWGYDRVFKMMEE